MLTVDEKTWIISDTHFGHKNIVKYCGRPKNHNELMFRNWKRLVKPNDIVLHLGDVAVWYKDADASYWAHKAAELPGIKYLIIGNHDEHYSDYGWSKIGFEVIKPFQQNQIYFSHEPMNEGIWFVNIHGHTHNHTPFKKYMREGFIYYNASI